MVVGYRRDYQPPAVLTRNIMRAHHFADSTWNELHDARQNAVEIDPLVVNKLLELGPTGFVAEMVLTSEQCNHFEAQTRELRSSYDQSWRDKTRVNDRRISQIRWKMIWWTVGVSIVLTLTSISIVVLSAGNSVMWMVGYLVFVLLMLFWTIIVLDRMTKKQLAGPSSLEHYAPFHSVEKQLIVKLWVDQNQ